MSSTHFRYPPPPTPPPGARQTPPLVGLQLYANNLHSPLQNDHYDPNIMHRVVPPTLQQVTVTTDASSVDIAATFSLPVAYVVAHWLTSRTPMQLPGYEKAVTHNLHNAPDIVLRRRPLSPTELASYRDLAVALTTKLDAYAQLQQPNPTIPSRPSRAHIERLHAQAIAAFPDTAASTSASTSTVSSSSEPTISADLLLLQPPLQQRRTKDRCAFSTANSHPDLHISPDRKKVIKKCKGLYRCARTTAPLCFGWNYYVEYLVTNNPGHGGICVGLSSADTPLNRLVGTTHSSVGFHSSGKLVVRKGEWLPYGKTYGEGDTVAMLVEMPTERASDISSAESLSAPSGVDKNQTNQATNTTGTRSPSCSAPRITFFINGQSQGTLPLPDDTFLLEDKDCAPLLLATACLYHVDSSVEIKCCASEWEYFPSASAICSPLRATCHRRNSRLARGSSISTGAEAKRKTFRPLGHRELGGCDSVLTP